MQGFQKKISPCQHLLVSNVGASAALWFSEQVLFLLNTTRSLGHLYSIRCDDGGDQRQQPLQVLDIELLRRFFFGCTTTGPAHMTTRSMPMPAPACGYEPYLNASM